MANTKAALSKSLIALLLCFSLLIGTTFAWFTDNVTSSGNIIKSGNLDIKMYWTDDLDSGNWYDVEDDRYNTVFSYENWEPGYTDVRYIKLVNNGNLALNYKLTLSPEGEIGKLAEVINVYFADSKVEVNNIDDLDKLSAIGLLNNVMNGGTPASGTLLAADQYSPLHPSKEVIVTIAMNMITSAGNDYQEETSGDFTIAALATQAPFENDVFGSDYDSTAEFPVLLNSSKVSANVTPVDGKVPQGGVALNGETVSAFVPAGVALENGTDKLTLTVTPLNKSTSDIKPVNNEILVPVDVHIDGVADGNTVPMVINLGEILPKYLNMGNYHLFHVENGVNSVMTLVDSESELTAHNTYTYDPLTGEVSVAMASFSEVALVADTSKAWMGESDFDWYTPEAKESKSFKIANADQLHAFSQIVGGMAGEEPYDFSGATVTLLSDINLNHGTVLPELDSTITTKTIFYPIGNYNDNNFVSSNI